MSNREVIAEANGCELAMYVMGDCRIEHPASQTCSIWLTADEVAEIKADPATMSRWETEESMEMEAKEEEDELHGGFDLPTTGLCF